MGVFIDLTGKRFGYLKVIGKVERRTGNQIHWQVECYCGTIKDVAGNSLRHGRVVSCGCKQSHTTHGASRSRVYKMWAGTKSRAKASGIEHTIKYTDIKLVDTCPVLGITLNYSNNKLLDDSPSLDRMDNSRGYVKDNIRVISFKANRIKCDASVQDIEAVLAYMKGETN